MSPASKAFSERDSAVDALRCRPIARGELKSNLEIARTKIAETSAGRVKRMEETEITGKEIENFVKLQADEGKTPEEALEALMKVVGAEMPKFKED